VSVPLAQVPAGVTVQQFGNRLAFVVRDGDRFTVFDTNVQHLRGENGLWWCPKEQIFVAPTHAETFTRSGKAIGGPAAAGLDRFRATVRHDRLSIDPTHVLRGTKGNAQTAAGQIRGNDVGPWDSGPGSFCDGAFKANNAATPTSVLDVTALATLEYDKKIYDVPAGLIEIRLSGADGITFTFDDPRYRYCLLAPEPGARHTCRVALSPGDYLVYDTVPGHRQAGEEATIHVNGPNAPAPTQPTTATPPST
jgi:nitrite reductase/ring-hydroxylating ferredoxin subunit